MVCDAVAHGATMLFEGARLVRSTYMKRELSLSGMGIGLGNLKNQVVSLVSTAPPLMPDVKMEDVVADNTSGSGAELSFAGRNVYKEIHTVMKSERILYDIPVQRMPEPVEQSGEDIMEGVHAVTCDPKKYICWIVELSNSEHDRQICRI